MQITVSIVEDNRGTRENLVALLNGEPGLRCLNAYASGEEAVRGIPADKPDVALVDIKLPSMNGIECVARLKTLLPELRLLMLTTYEEHDLIFNSLRAGASGYLLKQMLHGELVQAIEQVHAGGAPMSMQIARKVVSYFNQFEHPAADVETLTRREHEILELLAKGYYYKEIGSNLNISMNTVRTHLKHIYEKLHVQSRKDATLKFFGRH
ncbi:MAG TPA: response regulator transcription factor [Candidatus Acidoferrales bacterium]|jgi:DNA-binding NarL/FixJ family response regulator|nr:response regulator transcription factor [Candidatus Acidoferrales bacterium]